MTSLFDIFTVIRHFGLRTIALGLWHRFERKSGLLRRRFPTPRWDEIDISDLLCLSPENKTVSEMIDPERFLDVGGSAGFTQQFKEIVGDPASVISAADDVIAGRFRYFFNTSIDRGGEPDWHLNPFTQKVFDSSGHWCRSDYFSAEKGDIKCVWELSRFYWAYDLARAYVLTGHQKYPERFWHLFESWLAANQPNRGVHWVSGQECALRIMALCFAFFAFRNSPSITAIRTEGFVKALAIHAARIKGFISHAVRQKTNHAMTEAAGLYTVGLVFPFLKNAQRWRQLGKRILEQEGLRQIYPDGGYVQQSMNYHRLMLHAYLWSLSLGRINNDEFSEELKDRLVKAAEFLYQLQDEATGRLPNYGDNDGALILPLNTCIYLDYRPVIRAMSALLKRTRVYERGPWDEDLLWLLGQKALEYEEAENPRTSTAFPQSGYFTIRCSRSWAMIRCHSYRDRVGHVDMMHLDLWAEGVNLLTDCGTYSYFAPEEPEAEKYFRSIRAHNSVVIDGESPLRLLSRFMWVPLPKAEIEEFDKDARRIRWKGRSLAYNRRPWKALHTREITAGVESNEWTVVDTVSGSGRHTVELRWHVPLQATIESSDDHTVSIKLSDSWRLHVKGTDAVTYDLLKGQPDGGWQSLYYNSKQPIATLAVKAVCALPIRFETTLISRR
jgi:hypothetical protein